MTKPSADTLQYLPFVVQSVQAWCSYCAADSGNFSDIQTGCQYLDMCDSLAYKPNAMHVVGRLRSLFGRGANDRIFATMEIPSPALGEFRSRYSAGYCDYPDPAARITFWDKLLGERAVLEDDSIPSVYLSEFDQGLFGGLLGGEVQFMAHPDTGWISSMVAPLLADWSEFDALRFDRAHPWFRRYEHQTKTFAEAARGKFGISHFVLIDSLNFVFELIGATRTYLSLDEHPEMVRRAIDFAFELNVDVQETFMELAPAMLGGTLQGGTVSNMVQWIPGRIVSESVDPFHMTSVDYFERWGREPIERMFARFDGGVLHIHGNGRHLLEAVSTLNGLEAIALLDDVGYPAAFDVLEELQPRTGNIPLVVRAGFDAFCERLRRHKLRGNVLYDVSGVPDADAANRCMEEVRDYRV